MLLFCCVLLGVSRFIGFGGRRFYGGCAQGVDTNFPGARELEVQRPDSNPIEDGEFLPEQVVKLFARFESVLLDALVQAKFLRLGLPSDSADIF